MSTTALNLQEIEDAAIGAILDAAAEAKLYSHQPDGGEPGRRERRAAAAFLSVYARFGLIKNIAARAAIMAAAKDAPELHRDAISAQTVRVEFEMTGRWRADVSAAVLAIIEIIAPDLGRLIADAQDAAARRGSYPKKQT